MNAGKSTMLLQSSYNYHERGMATLLFTPQIDSRFQVGKIHSRIGLQSEAIIFTPDDNLLIEVKVNLNQIETRVACVLVDEAQFLTKDQVLQLTDVCDELNVPVLCYGLRTDYRGELFEGSKYLLGYAEELVEIKTVCHCGRKATMNMRINERGEAIKEGEQIHIGGNESYVSTCRYHFKHAKPSCERESALFNAFMERTL